MLNCFFFSSNRNKLLLIRYEMLCKFFDSMVTSIRLLQGRSSTPTFAKILTMSQILVERCYNFIQGDDTYWLVLLPSSSLFPCLSDFMCLTETLSAFRSFTYAHLAQSMYIMPEAIMIKKVVLHDETTCCVKPALQITLQVDAVAENINGESGSKYSILTKLFRERIVDFYNGHPQVLPISSNHHLNQFKYFP